MLALKRTLLLPLAVLALVLQVMAPGVASAAAARMADPFSNLPICSTDLGGERGPQAPGQAPAHDCQLCTVCSVATTGAPPTTEEPPAPAALHAAAPWPVLESAGPRGPPRPAAQARAPPAAS